MRPGKGSARQYELMYVLADERDVVQVRTNHRGEQVYRYRTTATPRTGPAAFGRRIGSRERIGESAGIL